MKLLMESTEWLGHPNRSRRVVGSNPIWGSDISEFSVGSISNFISYINDSLKIARKVHSVWGTERFLFCFVLFFAAISVLTHWVPFGGRAHLALIVYQPSGHLKLRNMQRKQAPRLNLKHRASMYSRIPITRTFRGNRKRFELSGVRVTGSWEQMTWKKEKRWCCALLFIQCTF